MMGKLIPLALCLVAQSTQADVCAPGATLDYPVSETLNQQTLTVSNARYMAINYGEDLSFLTDPTPAQQAEMQALFRVTLDDQLSGRPQAEQDALIMMMLDGIAGRAQGLLHVVGLDDAYAIPVFLEVLERNGQRSHARILQRTMGLFGPPDMPYKARYDIWLEAYNAKQDQRLLTRLDDLNRRWKALEPLRDIALERLKDDPFVAIKYEAIRKKTDDWTRMSYLSAQLMTCIDVDQSYGVNRLDEFAKMPQPQQDLLRLIYLDWETVDGGFLEYFSSPVSDQVIEEVKLLDRYDLTDHAAALKAGMGYFPQPYPTDYTAREDIVYAMDETTAEAFFLEGAPFENAPITDVIKALAQDNGLWPE